MNRAVRIVIIAAVAIGVAYLRAQNRRGSTALTRPPSLATAASLADARRAHPTHLVRRLAPGDAPPVPPAGTFDRVRYPAGPGAMWAYVTPDPKDGKRHPAIVWITGGDCNSIGDAWTPADRDNDQSAGAYRTAGVAMMFPSLRGGNDGPGSQEKFFGEVDDVVAAADYLAGLPWVDPQRIYLGGHSTGGTLALLVAESTDRFRAAFCFGPVADVRGYGDGLGPWPFDLTDATEVTLRSPGYWLTSVRSPTFVLEGDGRGNVGELRRMRATAGDLPNLHWAIVPGKSHFSILAPANELIAQKVLADTAAAPAIEITDADVGHISSH